jgi:hypothetical protein
MLIAAKLELTTSCKQTMLGPTQRFATIVLFKVLGAHVDEFRFQHMDCGCVHEMGKCSNGGVSAETSACALHDGIYAVFRSERKSRSSKYNSLGPSMSYG